MSESGSANANADWRSSDHLYDRHNDTGERDRTDLRGRKEAVATDAYDEGMTFTEQLRESIESRLQELRAEIIKFEDARKALSNGSAEAPKTRANGATAKPRKRRQSTRVMLAGEIERILGESGDDLSTSAIAEQGGADPAQVLSLLRELENTGQVRRTGARRGTRWHLITDEDRIAERAAELASRSKVQAPAE